jgi:hypothetical protein
VDVGQGPRLLLHSAPLGLRHERGRPAARVPVVVGEVMEARLGDAAAKHVSMLVVSRFERHREVERAPRREARAGGDDTRVFTLRRPDGALVRMRGEELDPARRRVRIAQELMRGLGPRDPLEVAVVAGVVVGPRDAGRPVVVGDTPLGIGLGVLRLEMVRGADSSERAERKPHVLVVARGQDASAALAEPCDALAVAMGQPVSRVQSEEPELVERRAVQGREHGVVLTRRGLPIARGHLEPGLVLPKGGQALDEKGKTQDRPVVHCERRGHLDENPHRSPHFSPRFLPSGGQYSRASSSG